MDKEVLDIERFRKNGFRFGALLGIAVGLLGAWTLSDGAKNPIMLYLSIAALCSLVFAILSYVTFSVIIKRKIARLNRS